MDAEPRVGQRRAGLAKADALDTDSLTRGPSYVGELKHRCRTGRLRYAVKLSVGSRIRWASEVGRDGEEDAGGIDRLRIGRRNRSAASSAGDRQRIGGGNRQWRCAVRSPCNRLRLLRRALGLDSRHRMLPPKYG